MSGLSSTPRPVRKATQAEGLAGGDILAYMNPLRVAEVVAQAVTGTLKFKGNINASTNPNYPAGVIGDTYLVSVAGKVGGASGEDVEIGDYVIANADNAGGNQATVGSSWFVLQGNTLPSGGGGGFNYGPNTHYVQPTFGNNTTGDGSASNPWATIQKALDEGAETIVLGEGAAGVLTFSSAKNISIRGSGGDESQINYSWINGIVCHGGHTVTINDIGKHSFMLQNTILGEGVGENQAGSLFYFNGVKAILQGGSGVQISASGGAGVSQAGSGAGALILQNGCNFRIDGGITGIGADGGPGDESNSGQQGGNGAYVSVKDSRLDMNGSLINMSPGAAGGDGGAGAGSPGSNGVFEVIQGRVSNYSLTGESKITRGAVLNDAFIATEP